MWQSKLLKKKIDLNHDYSKIRYTVDTLDDFNLFSFIIDSFTRKEIFSIGMKKIIKLLLKNKKRTSISKKLAKNSGWLPSFEKDKSYIRKFKNF